MDAQVQQMNQKDSRIKLLNEILNGIKVIKFYAWENPFKELVMKIRKGELSVLLRYTLLNAAYSFTWTCAPFMVSLINSCASFILSLDPHKECDS